MADIKKLSIGFVIFLFVLSIFPVFALALPPEATEVPPDPPKKDKRIVMVMVDGLQAESLSPSRSPNLSGLAISGLKADKVVAMPPDNTAARLYTILSGVDPEVHGFKGPESAAKASLLLSQMESKGIKTALIDGTGNLARAGGNISQKVFGPFDNDSQVLVSALDVIKNQKPFLTAVVLSGPGRQLLETGKDSKEYNDSVTVADTQVGKLIKQLHMDGTYEETLLIITGTTGKPPLLIKGNEFVSGMKMTPVCLKDIASTLAYLYGMDMPREKGLIMWNAFKPTEAREEKAMLAERVSDLSTAYAGAVDSASRLEAEKILVQEEKLLMARDKQFVEGEIQVREKEIDRLQTMISVIKIIGLGVSILWLVSLFVEYKILKKRYLFFT